MTLIIENVKKEYVEAFQGLANEVKANMKTLIEYDCNENDISSNSDNNINDNITENGYTEEFEKELLNDREQMQKEYKHGNALIFNNHDEFKKAVENGKIHDSISQKVC